MSADRLCVRCGTPVTDLKPAAAGATMVAHGVCPEFADVKPATAAGGYFVSSASTPGAWYFVAVRPGSITCSCPRGREIELAESATACRHMRRLLAFTRAEEAKHRRPSAPANVSALVD